MNRLCACLVASLSLSMAPAWAQKWEFVTYRGNQAADVGYVLLEEAGGEATFRMVAPSLDKCWDRPLKAEVSRTESMLLIVPQFTFAGCVPQRFQIQLDGKGGFTEFKQGESWARSSRDRRLTLVR